MEHKNEYTPLRRFYAYVGFGTLCTAPLAIVYFVFLMHLVGLCIDAL